MKKKILFTMLFVVVLSLLAVFSVSAEEYNVVDNLGDPSWYTGNYELITDKTSSRSQAPNPKKNKNFPKKL